ncbi:porin family protein [Aliiglaciecola sp. LCG003]|uniref:porin family protein n=1 Tax=Aliiglaciecola sp. LCG003 TaxID=3053655 RepID=UPI00257240F6|nr:porin family protein [Aliiglaciecola sp. LCG003]WJG10679.1 porin family protein [Aliiglaciecola sp. LCG003]
MKKLSLITSLMALGALPTPAAAQSVNDADAMGAYLGANYGYLRVDGDDDFDDDKDAYQFIAGYSFNEYFALEGSYIDFGSYGNNVSNADTDGYTFGLVAGMPLSETIGLYVKGGQLWYETDYTVLGVRDDYDDKGLFAGVGLSFKLTNNWSVKLDYTLYDVDLDAGEAVDDFDDANFSTDLKQASIGVQYLF